jgi:hypothetical protein
VRTGRITLTVVAALAAATVGAAAAWALAGDDGGPRPGRTPGPEEVVQTSFPDLAPVSAEPRLAGLRDTHPLPGSVARITGPFDDRIEVGRLELDGDRLTGRVLVTSDVSDVLELQVVAGFYDLAGRYLGSGRFIHHDLEESAHEGSPDEALEFEIAFPRGHRDEVRSAAVGVPLLVNE